MKSKVKAVLALMCAIVLVGLSGCSSAAEGLEALKTNTTVDEATQDIFDLNNAIIEAKAMVESRNTKVYGDLVHTDSVSFKDVIIQNELDEQAGTKRIDGVSYYLYWDNERHYPFWSTDGFDDIRNNQENMMYIKHDDSMRIKNKTNVTALK